MQTHLVLFCGLAGLVAYQSPVAARHTCTFCRMRTLGERMQFPLEMVGRIKAMGAVCGKPGLSESLFFQVDARPMDRASGMAMR